MARLALPSQTRSSSGASCPAWSSAARMTSTGTGDSRRSMCARTRSMAGSVAPSPARFKASQRSLDELQGLLEAALLAIDWPQQDGQARPVDPGVGERFRDDVLGLGETSSLHRKLHTAEDGHGREPGIGSNLVPCLRGGLGPASSHLAGSQKIECFGGIGPPDQEAPSASFPRFRIAPGQRRP